MRKSCWVMILVASTGILLSLFGCYMPENFQAKLTVNKDGSYVFMCEGTFFDSYMDFISHINIEEKYKKAELAAAEKRLNDIGFKDLKNLGDFHYKGFFQKIGKPGEEYYFLSKEDKIFIVQSPKNGTLIITAIPPTQWQIQNLEMERVNINGTLTVSVAENSEVVDHNAQDASKLNGAFKEYTWKIVSPRANPFIIIKSNIQ